ncbi:hypothetical protein Tco_0115058 [Tanacetum coccineum]
MSSIMLSTTKLDLELFQGEKDLRLNCNERLILKDTKKNPLSSRSDSRWIKRKRFKLNLEIFRDIFKICPRVQGQDFDALLTDEEIVSCLNLSGKTNGIGQALFSKSTISFGGKSKRVKRPVKKSTKAPARGVVIRETPEMTLSKKKDKEVRRKSMRDFHKTHPSGSGTVTKTAPSAAKIKPYVTMKELMTNNNKQDSSGEDSDQENDSDDVKTQSDNENESNSEHETDENESGSESDQEENEEDEDDEELVKIQSKCRNCFSMDVSCPSEVPIQHTPTLLIVNVSVITILLRGFSIDKMDKSESYLGCSLNTENDMKSQSKSSGKSVQSEEPEFEVADLDMPQDQEENPANDDEEPKEKVASKRGLVLYHPRTFRFL